MNSSGGYVYVLHGENTFDRDDTLRKLKQRMRALPTGEHNLTELSDGEATVASLRAAADAMPFLADRRLVVVHGLLGRLQGRGQAPRRSRARTPDAREPKSADELSQLREYLARLPETASVAFVEGARVDPGPVVQAVAKGRILVREFPKVWDVAQWLRARARAAGVDLDEAAVRELARLGGDDLRRLDGEIRKLGTYAVERTVTREDVQLLVVGRDTVVWALLDALADRRRERALAALRHLYEQGEPPEALIGRDVAPLYRRLMAAHEVAGVARSERAALDLSSLGLNPRTLPKLQEQAAGFETAEIEQALEVLLDLDRSIKTGECDPEASLELAVVRLCSRLSPAVA